MPRTEDVDHELRVRLRAWLRYYADTYQHHYGSQTQLAAALGVSQSWLSQALSGRRSIGLDALVRLHRTLHVSLDVLVDTDPPRALPPDPPLALAHSVTVAARGSRGVS